VEFLNSRPAVACHPERSEGSLRPANQILRFAQDDIALMNCISALIVTDTSVVPQRELDKVAMSDCLQMIPQLRGSVLNGELFESLGNKPSVTFSHGLFAAIIGGPFGKCRSMSQSGT
jgi:hypothetical protein